jgi:hypothetical protein
VKTGSKFAFQIQLAPLQLGGEGGGGEVEDMDDDGEVKKNVDRGLIPRSIEQIFAARDAAAKAAEENRGAKPPNLTITATMVGWPIFVESLGTFANQINTPADHSQYGPRNQSDTPMWLNPRRAFGRRRQSLTAGIWSV